MILLFILRKGKLIMRYYLCWAERPDDLSELVNSYLEDGWSLYGLPFNGPRSPMQYPDTYNSTVEMSFPSHKYYPSKQYFCQAVIKKDK